MLTENFEKRKVEVLGYWTNPWEVHGVAKKRKDEWAVGKYITKWPRFGRWPKHDVIPLSDVGDSYVAPARFYLYCRYEQRKGWIRYPASERAAATRTAFLFHCIHSQNNGACHCEPLVKWPVERSVFLIFNGKFKKWKRNKFYLNMFSKDEAFTSPGGSEKHPAKGQSVLGSNQNIKTLSFSSKCGYAIF